MCIRDSCETPPSTIRTSSSCSSSCSAGPGCCWCSMTSSRTSFPAAAASGTPRSTRCSPSCATPPPSGSCCSPAGIRCRALTGSELRRLFLRLPALRALPQEDRTLVARAIGGHPRLIEFVDALLRRGRTELRDTARKLRALAREHQLDLRRPRALDDALDDAVLLGAADI